MATSTGGANPQPKENLPKPVKQVRDQYSPSRKSDEGKRKAGRESGS